MYLYNVRILKKEEFDEEVGKKCKNKYKNKRKFK